MNETGTWRDIKIHQLVRYEALVNLLEDIQLLDDIEKIALRIASQWKYFANAISWRLVVPASPTFLVIDGLRGTAHVSRVENLEAWDARFWRQQLPLRISLPLSDRRESPPVHLLTPDSTEIVALPFAREGTCFGLLSVSAHQVPFNDMDMKFIQIMGRQFANRVADILLQQRAISELKQIHARQTHLESQLRESQKMEALGTLAGGVAHDFNNALATIIGNVELARQDVGPDHAALISLEEIDKASRRAKDLVQQILAFGRRQKLERKATSLALVVVETARLIRATLPVTVSMNVECDGNTPVVLADATQVKQILLNLCSNAMQAVQKQGRPGVVEVRLEDCTLDGTSVDLRPGRYARLTVRDNGIGMNESMRARIFEPFFTTKPKGEGTGLGLSVVHGIVQAHEATIEVESAPGKGSAFRIYFPALDASVEEVAQCEEAGVQVDGAGKRVLYIDDEEAIIFLMKRLLERQGFRVSGYTDPREALAVVKANPGDFDLAVTDYNMPGMSGLDVAYALREIRVDLPVVLASGYITEDLRQRAPAAGVRELIYKPNTVDDLCEAVARYANAQIRNKSSSSSN